MDDIDCLRILLTAMAQCGNARIATTFCGQEDDYDLYLTYDSAVAENSQGVEVLVLPKKQEEE